MDGATVRETTEREALERFLRRDTGIHLYALCPPGDPDTIELVRRLEPRLPGRLFTDVGLGVECCRCYRRLGFESECRYVEQTFERLLGA